METQIVIEINDKILEKVKRYASKQGKTVSEIIIDYLLHLGEDNLENLPPKTKKLLGALSKANYDPDEYNRYLAKKYS